MKLTQPIQYTFYLLYRKPLKSLRPVVAGCLALLTSTVFAVDTPQVTPSPEGTHGFPFGSSSLDLSRYGYVEEEFLVSGMANSYVAPAPLGNDGKWAATPAAEKAPFKTRMIVRRPAKSSRFNGTVVVEWLNVSGGIDATPDWSLMYEELLREGYAYVAVSAQFIGTMFLTTWEQGPDARYAGVFHPGDSFSYDIFSQASAAVRNPQDGNAKPLGKLTKKIKAVIATGHSQSGSRMQTYVNAVQPLEQIFDAALVRGPFGPAALSQASAAATLDGTTIPALPGMPATADLPAPATAFLRDDLNQPVLLLNSETEVNLPFASFGVHLQPDSELVRIWEVTGAAHADDESLAVLRSDANKSLGPSPTRDCGDLPTNNGSAHGQVVRAAVAALNRWVRYGAEAPTGDRIQLNLAAFPPTIVRDPGTGLAVGGIRLPEIEVPTSSLSGVRPTGIAANDQFCFLFGASDAWNGDSDSYDGQAYDPSGTPEPILLTLYPTHETYVSGVVHSSLSAMFDGFLRPTDAFETIYSAITAPIPQ